MSISPPSEAELVQPDLIQTSKPVLVDRFGRVHDTLRVSVTDRCNLRCKYCMPADGVPFVPRSELLSYEELTAVVRVAADLGVTRLRITGGEPLLRRDLADFVRMVRAETKVRDIAMTTNGVLLARHAAELADAGLDRINVSLDSLDAERFRQITRFGLLDDVWAGIEAAVAAGLSPIKINTLLLAGFNTDEVDRWVELTVERDITVRFMELMPVGDNDLSEVGGYQNVTEVRRRLERDWGLVPAGADVHRGNGPARYWKVPGARGAVGFITPISNGYCNSCRRLRLTSTGELRACLADDRQVRLGHAIARGDDKAVEAGFLWAVDAKPRGHNWRAGERTEIGMSEVGG